MTYPQPEHFPTLDPPFPDEDSAVRARAKQRKSILFQQLLKQDARAKRDGVETEPISEARLARRDAWKRDLAGRANGTIDPYYQCDLFDEMIDYAENFTFPWSACFLLVRGSC